MSRYKRLDEIINEYCGFDEHPYSNEEENQKGDKQLHELITRECTLVDSFQIAFNETCAETQYCLNKFWDEMIKEPVNYEEKWAKY
jgi:hypothetical protein